MRLTSIALAAMLAHCPAISGQGYTVGRIGAFDGQGTAIATDINDVGQIVGYRDIPENPHAFLWSNGTITELGNESGEFTRVLSAEINNVGQVVGSRFTSEGRISAFLWDNGTTLDLGTLRSEDEETYAFSINDAGLIGGTSGSRPFIWERGIMRDFTVLSGGASFDWVGPINNQGVVGGTVIRNAEIQSRQAALWNDGQTVDLGDLPGGTGTGINDYSVPSAINDKGQVVGRSDGANGHHAFLWSNGIMADLGALPGLSNISRATDINNAGVVVGHSGNEISHAFVWDSIEGMRDLNSLLDESGTGWILTRAYAINNHGQIVGAGIHNGQAVGFLLTPIPEPSTLATAAVALACAASIATRRLFRSDGNVPS
jgi:probable HAF family extracellular repeat protein